MPIKPENRHLYGKDWKLRIRPAILARAGDSCEGSPAYPDCRAANHERHPVTGAFTVLTVAHLDHDATNNDFGNLRALCQRCHNTHDITQRRESRRKWTTT